MKRRTFLASLIGLCLAPLAKVKAVIAHKPSPKMFAGFDFGNSPPSSVITIWIGDRLLYSYRAPEGKSIAISKEPDLVNTKHWWEISGMALRDGRGPYPKDFPVAQLLRLEWIER